MLVHAADIQDSDLAAWLLANVRQACPTLQLMWVDQGYKDWVLDAARIHDAITLEQVHTTAEHVGVAVQPRRWVVERTCAWLGRGRRLSKDDETLPENSESVVSIGAIRLMLKRLTK